MTKLAQAEIRALRDSFKAASPVPVKATERFFGNLFEAAPALEAPFYLAGRKPGPMLWMTIRLIVDNAEDLTRIDAPLQALGQRHLAFGARPEHYGAFADTMIGTIATIFGDGWTSVHESAWEKALGHAVDQMLAGSAKAAAELEAAMTGGDRPSGAREPAPRPAPLVLRSGLQVSAPAAH